MTEHDIDDFTSIAKLSAIAAREYNDVADNAGLIIESAVENIEAAIADARLTDDVPSGTQLVREWLARQVDSASSRRQKSMKARLTSGQQILNFGDDLDSIIKVCGKGALGDAATAGRIVILGNLTANDLILMGAESRKNRRAVDRADDELRAAIQASIPVFRGYDNYASFRAHIARNAS